MKTLNRYILFVMLTSGGLITTGCYTVLVHHHKPVQDQDISEQEVIDEEVCSLCGGQHPTLLHYSGMRRDPDFGVNSRWYGYYENPQPWWVNGEPAETDESAGETDDDTYSGRNYGRRRQALEEKTNTTTTGGAVQAGSGDYTGSASGGGSSTGTGAIVTTPSVQSDTTQGQSGDTTTGSASSGQNNENNNTQREYGGRTIKKKK
jgi:hypothetical protein